MWTFRIGALRHAAWIKVRAIRNRIGLSLVVFLIALNLRPALTSLSTVLDQVRAGMGASEALLGLLTMLAPLCFGLLGVLAPTITNYTGINRAITFALACLAGGLMVRMIPSTPALLLSTALAGIGIGLAGAVIPAVLKREFPQKLGLATGLYTMGMSAGASIAAAFTIVLQDAFEISWSIALGFWAAPAISATAAWWAVTRRLEDDRSSSISIPNLWTNRLAWFVTGFMGLQAALAFIVLGWLPVFLQARGIDAPTAGFVTSVSILSQLSTALAAPILATRLPSQRLLVLASLGIICVGFFGVMFAAEADVLAWGVLLGIGQGATFGLGLIFVGLRSGDTATAVSLSGMSQGFGYMIAALGPLSTGIVRQFTVSGDAQMVLFGCILAGAAVCGWVAGSDRQVLSLR